MTQLIIALDGPRPADLGNQLYQAGFTRFKIGLLTLGNDPLDFVEILYWSRNRKVKIFLDLKINDTSNTVVEVARRFATRGVAAISVTDHDSCTAALQGVFGTETQVWQWLWSSEKPTSRKADFCSNAHAIIIPAWTRLSGHAPTVRTGVRLPEDATDNHYMASMPPRDAAFAVVGRPIWQATDPVAAARRYDEALRKETP